MRPIRQSLVALLLLLLLAPGAHASGSLKKGIWGPARVDGVSQFPIYRELGAGVYHTSLSWAKVAPRRPADPRNPADPAYVWPSTMDDAVREAAITGIRVAIMTKNTPAWANGGRTPNWSPTRLGDYADFMAAMARRYPSVRYWVVWGEPTRRANFRPLPANTPHGKPLKRSQRAAVRRYARLLDLTYGAIKQANPRALVVGGNSFSYGDIGPVNWIKNLRLPSGRPPRMDLYGHNPFGPRRPDLSKDPLYRGTADFSDLDDLTRLVDRYLGRTPKRRRINLWIGEYALPTRPGEFSFWVSEATQASWLASALRITRRHRRIATMNWLTLRDRPAEGTERHPISFGLITEDGRRKPAFAAFQRG
jgi:hypothetical protein